MKLTELVRALGGALEGARSHEPEADVADVRLDSRSAGPGALFVALPGTRDDGARYALDALERGAAAVLAPSGALDVPDVPNLQRLSARAPLWVHPAARRVAGEAAALVHGEPVRHQRTVGVTGTNGKSTVAHLVGALLRHAGHRPAVVGTVEVKLWGAPSRPATHTTPDGPELQRLARENRERGGDALALEVSSHALDQERLAGFPLDVAIFTNLGRDHLDYHRDLESYARAKERIFGHLKAGGAALINGDDAAAGRMQRAAAACGARVFTYGTRSPLDLSATLTDVGPSGTTLFLEGMGIPRTEFFLPLIGRHNVENALAALAAVLFLGASPATAVSGLASLTAPRGRLEPVDTGSRGFRVFVDYAHTPDALERVLATLSSFVRATDERAPRRLICVFGCGGNRDREKRGPMGAAVARFADLALVTSDNPRDEEPLAIIEDILPGFERGAATVLVEPDRRRAIARALSEARAGDIVLVAGKGHEAWQQVRNERVPFEDRRVVLEELG